MVVRRKTRGVQRDAQIKRLQARLKVLLEAREKDTTRARLRAFPVGVMVEVTCTCVGGDHEGTWRVDRYSVEADDFHIVRVKDGKSDYATANALRRV
jgi:hypothetical protein